MMMMVVVVVVVLNSVKAGSAKPVCSSKASVVKLLTARRSTTLIDLSRRSRIIASTATRTRTLA